MVPNEITPQPYCLSEEIRDFNLVQLTDSHILSDPDAKLKGLNTRHSFEKVFTTVRQAHDRWDLLLATGDLSQDESAESYTYLADKLNRLDFPVTWVPGNHDHPETMSRFFRAGNILENRHILLGNWQIVLLDSSLAGVVHGQVRQAQLDFMHAALNCQADRHTLICLHHPAINCGSTWLDQKSLLDAEKFREAVCQHPNVRGVLWGHVHQEAEFHRNGIRWMSTPSTCIQFKPDSVEFALDTRSPGYRRLRLGTDGDIESEVIRVD